MTTTQKKSAKKSGRKSYTKPICIVAMVLIGFLSLCVLYYDPFTTETEVLGTIQNAFKSESKYKAQLRFVVKLETGSIVYVSGEKMGKFVKGKRAVFQEQMSSIFSRKSYKFLRYIDPPPAKK